VVPCHFFVPGKDRGSTAGRLVVKEIVIDFDPIFDRLAGTDLADRESAIVTFRVIAGALGLACLAAVAGCASKGADQPVAPISKASEPAPQTPVESRPKPVLSSVQQVQTSLRQLGFYTGAVDGIWGPASSLALSNYQKSQGLTVNGRIDAPVLAALNRTGDGTAPQQAASPAAPSTHILN
jgi:hypothetical protein